MLGGRGGGLHFMKWFYKKSLILQMMASLSFFSRFENRKSFKIHIFSKNQEGFSDAPIRIIEYSLRHHQQQGVSDLWQSAPLTENVFSISTFNFVVIF